MSYNVSVVVTTQDTPLPTGITYHSVVLTVTDAAGTVQTFPLNGLEATPWTQAVTVAADGASNYSAQAVDSTGATMGTAATATFTPAVGGPTTFPQPSNISVTAA